MTEQLDLGVAVPIRSKGSKELTGRQQLAFDYVRERGGVTADEVGAWLHAHRDKRPHSVDVRCDYCARDGRSVLTSKALGPLVTYKRAPGGSLYIARDKADRVREQTGGLIATSDPDPETNPWADL